jgi:hypothetical protein
MNVKPSGRQIALGVFACTAIAFTVLMAHVAGLGSVESVLGITSSVASFATLWFDWKRKVNQSPDRKPQASTQAKVTQRPGAIVRASSKRGHTAGRDVNVFAGPRAQWSAIVAVVAVVGAVGAVVVVGVATAADRRGQGRSGSSPGADPTAPRTKVDMPATTPSSANVPKHTPSPTQRQDRLPTSEPPQECSSTGLLPGNVLKNGDFSEASGQSGLVNYGDPGQQAAALGWGMHIQSSGQFISTSLLRSTCNSVPGKAMIHVDTNGPDTGLVCVFADIGRGLPYVQAKLWMYIVQGVVTVSLNENGSKGIATTVDAVRHWIIVSVPNPEQVPQAEYPKMELTIYSAHTALSGAEFYVDSASVASVPPTSVAAIALQEAQPEEREWTSPEFAPMRMFEQVC